MFHPTSAPFPNCERHYGIVVTPQLAGTFVGAIYDPNDADGKVYLMPRQLFKMDLKLGTAQNLSISKMQKMEEMLVFGDWVTFDASGDRTVQQIVGPAQQLCTPKTFGLVFTVKTVAVVSKDGRIWTSEFGVIPDRSEEGSGFFPISDVPVEAYVRCDYDLTKPFDISFGLYAFGEVAVDSRESVKRAPWNVVAVVPRLPSCSDSEDDDCPIQVQKPLEPTDKELKYNLKGVLSPQSICVSDQPDTEFLRAFQHDASRENDPEYTLPGSVVRFDAYYSHAHRRWIAFLIGKAKDD